MAEELLSPGIRSHRKMSLAEMRELEKKALQSYQKIATIKEISDKELNSSINTAELELEQFITSNKIPNGN